MVKKKMVIKLSLGDKKKRTKAFTTAAGVEGVISVELDDDDNRLVLVGEGTDVVEVTLLLRKKLGYAEVISVTDAEENSEEENPTSGTSTQQDGYPIYPYGAGVGVPSSYWYPYGPHFQGCIEYK